MTEPRIIITEGEYNAILSELNSFRVLVRDYARRNSELVSENNRLELDYRRLVNKLASVRNEIESIALTNDPLVVGFDHLENDADAEAALERGLRYGCASGKWVLAGFLLDIIDKEKVTDGG